MLSHESVSESFSFFMLRGVCVGLRSCICQYVQAHVRWKTNNIAILGNQFAFLGAAGEIMLLCLFSLLLCLPQFLPFSPSSVLRSSIIPPSVRRGMHVISFYVPKSV